MLTTICRWIRLNIKIRHKGAKRFVRRRYKLFMNTTDKTMIIAYEQSNQEKKWRQRIESEMQGKVATWKCVDREKQKVRKERQKGRTKATEKKRKAQANRKMETQERRRAAYLV